MSSRRSTFCLGWTRSKMKRILKHIWWALSYRNFLHPFIVWYLRKCGGAAHCYKYGPKGRYFVLMTEDEYHYYENIVRCSSVERACESFEMMIGNERHVG